MFLACDAAGHENAQVADRLMDRIDDRLPVGADFIDTVVKIENPSERLLGRGDIVALRAEYDDRRANASQVDCGSVRGLNSASREVVADEQLIDDELDLLGIEIDVAAPPAFESEVAWRFRIDLE